jgi:hypothetical protein
MTTLTKDNLRLFAVVRNELRATLTRPSDIAFLLTAALFRSEHCDLLPAAKGNKNTKLIFANHLAVRAVRERERERKTRARETERQRDRETERQRDRETERQRDRETERQRDRETETETETALIVLL